MNVKTLLNAVLLLLAILPFITQAQPIITSIAPEHGPVGTIVTINGSRFLTPASSNTVWFGPVKAEITEANANYLRVKVPGGAVYGDIIVVTGGLSYASPKPFNPTFDNGGFPILNATSFGSPLTLNNGGGSNPVDVYAGDFDGDGKTDFAVTNFSTGSISVYRNTSANGTIGFNLVKTIATGTNPWYITGGDLDRDGKLDLVVTNSGSSNISVLKNISTTGNINFDAKKDYGTGRDPKDAVVCDFNKDGMPDIAVSNYGANTVTVLKNKGVLLSIGFEQAGTYNTGSAPFGIAAGDIDGDGKSDIVVSNAGSGNVSVFKNNSSPATFSFAFADAVNFGTGDWPQAVAVGDINQDGKPDIISLNLFSNNISILKNTGAGNIAFAGKADFPTNGAGYSISINDINGDNKPDIITANGGGSINILRNTTHLNSLSFEQRVNYPAGRYISGVTAADVDGDGRADIIAADENGNSIAVLKNQVNLPSITSFSPQAGNALTKITITGNNFSNVSGVTVGGVAATWFQVVNATTIIAMPGNASSGKIEVITTGGTAEKGGFNFTPYCFAGSNNVINKITHARIGTFNYSGLPATASYSNYLNQRTTILPANQSYLAVNLANSLADQTASVFIDFNKDGDFDDAGENILNAGPTHDKFFSGYLNVPVTADSGINIMRIRLTNTGTGSNATACGLSASGQVIDFGVYISIPPPVITRLDYTSGVINTSIQIQGQNLFGTYSVTFGGVPATITSINGNGTLMSCKVGAGATGDVVVNAPGGTAMVKNGFTYLAPQITAVSPIEAKAGTRVTITGENFTAASAVSFGGVPARSFEVGNNHIYAYPASGHSGEVSVTTYGGTAKFAGFVYLSPVITSFSPAAVAEGGTVIIKGKHFKAGDFANASHVTFGGINARSFTVVNDTMITAVVDKGASGAIAVTVAGVTTHHNGFIFAPAPGITSLSPTTGGVGTVVTITGTNLTRVTAVTVAGIPAKSFQLVSDNVITAVLSYDPTTQAGFGRSGDVLVTCAGLTVNAGRFNFTNYCFAGGVNPDALKISKVTVGSFTNESSSKAGYENFLGLHIPVHVGVNAVTVLASRPEDSARVVVYADFNKDGDFADSNETIFISPKGKSPFNFHLTVPANAVAGETRLRVAIFGPTNTYAISACDAIHDQAEDYTLAIPVIPAPVITSFAPTRAGGDSTVVIHGSGFTGTTQVSFGGFPAKSFHVRSSTEIAAIVGGGASGEVSITAASTAKMAGFTYINPPAPVITSFLPKAAGKGAIIHITGTGLNWATSVDLGGTPAAFFTINSPTSITAVVGDGASGDLAVVTHTSAAIAPGFTFLNYCYASGRNDYSQEKLIRVTVGGIDNDISAFNLRAQGYINFSNLAAHLRTGLNPVSIKISSGQSNAKLVAYIDFNQDGDFEDDSERIVVNQSPAEQFNFNINVPVTVLSGATRMRLRLTGSNSYWGDGPCGLVQVGQVQDYTLVMPVVPAPVITSFTPTHATLDSIVVIRGTGFLHATSVAFGGSTAKSFHVISDSEITAKVGIGASGSVTVTGSATASRAGFTFIPLAKPTITSFSPARAGKGGVVHITGTGLNWVTSVMFGDQQATSFTIQSPTSITAVVGEGSSGDVNVLTNWGLAVAQGFTYLNYCNAAGTNIISGNYEKIQSVTTGSFTNDTRDYYGYPYFNYNASQAHLHMGTNSMQVPITRGQNYAQLGVYIDFNQDGDFDDSDEVVYLSSINPGAQSFGFDYKVPATALAGATRMRVRLASTSYAQAQPCGTIGYGQVQDYTVIIPHHENGLIMLQTNKQQEKITATGQLAVSAMPNPTKTSFTLKVTGDANKPVEVRVMDMQGKVLYHEKGAANRNYLFGSNFAQGMYIAQVLQGDKVQAIKLVKAQ